MTDLVRRARRPAASTSSSTARRSSPAFISTGNYYQLLGVNARLGRTILPDDDRPDAPPVAVISSKYWHSRFGTDPAVVGKIVKINNVLVTIVGVLPPEFTGVQQPSGERRTISFRCRSIRSSTRRLRRPSSRVPPRLTQPTYWWLQVMGRLKPGATAAQVQGNLEGVFQQTARAGLDCVPDIADRRERGDRRAIEPDRRCRGCASNPAPRHLRRQHQRPACRHDPQRRRRAGAADRLRQRRQPAAVARDDAAEGDVGPAVARRDARAADPAAADREPAARRRSAARSALLVGYWGQQLLPGPPGQATPLDWRVLAFVLAVTALTGIVFGIAPALRATGMNVSAALKETSRASSGSRSLLSKSLLVVQVAISLVLLDRRRTVPADAAATCGTSTSASIRRTCCCSASTRS